MKQNDANEIIFKELKFRSLTVKNRVFRSSISGRFDNYDGSGTYVRINWEEKFAAGGVGAIISSYVPVHTRGRILPNYAMIHHDGTIPFWTALGERVHRHDCKFILQLSHSGRQQDLGGVENLPFKAQSSTSKREPFHGFLCTSMTREEIKYTVQCFAEGARRAKAAGLDGVETHSSNGYLINQFLSSGINDRKDEYGGSVENRARFLVEIIRAIRKAVGDDFHVQAKISALEYNDVVPFEKRGNTLEESIAICQMLEEAGVDAIHVSTGSMFPHPRNPAGDFPLDDARRWYDGLLSSGSLTMRNYLMFRYRLLHPLFRRIWFRHLPEKTRIEGLSAENARAIKGRVRVPVIVTGGFQTASVIAETIRSGASDAVSIARPLLANNDLVKMFERGLDAPPNPCTYCNKCLLNVLENPLACYDLDRYGGDYIKMMQNAMSVYYPSPYGGGPPPFAGLVASEPSQGQPVPLEVPSTAPVDGGSLRCTYYRGERRRR
ncbi:NADH:flavin oxidoreductase [Sorangium sp. So ce388]|uniref:NADH:flavin oxidoreductase n=1 Tax=Sorangium sp. So ce388 TaxID=3133309 RepID=UPI003F5C9F6E